MDFTFSVPPHISPNASTGTSQKLAVSNYLFLNYNISMKFTFSVPPHINPNASTSLHPTVIVNRTIVLNCVVTGIPEPDITWQQNGLDVTLREGKMTILSGGARLEIKDSKVSDSARYTCLATNQAGRDFRNFDLSVLGNCIFFLFKLISSHWHVLKLYIHQRWCFKYELSIEIMKSSFKGLKLMGWIPIEKITKCAVVWTLFATNIIDTILS